MPKKTLIGLLSDSHYGRYVRIKDSVAHIRDPLARIEELKIIASSQHPKVRAALESSMQTLELLAKRRGID